MTSQWLGFRKRVSRDRLRPAPSPPCHFRSTARGGAHDSEWYLEVSRGESFTHGLASLGSSGMAMEEAAHGVDVGVTGATEVTTGEAELTTRAAEGPRSRFEVGEGPPPSPTDTAALSMPLCCRGTLFSILKRLDGGSILEFLWGGAGQRSRLVARAGSSQGTLGAYLHVTATFVAYAGRRRRARDDFHPVHLVQDAQRPRHLRACTKWPLSNKTADCLGLFGHSTRRPFFRLLRMLQIPCCGIKLFQLLREALTSMFRISRGAAPPCGATM